MIGKELRRLRELQGLSLRDVAKLVNISASTLSRIETGSVPPSIDDLKQFAEVYRCDYMALVVIAGYMTTQTGDVQRNILTAMEITEDEARELLTYLAYLRWKQDSYKEPRPRERT